MEDVSTSAATSPASVVGSLSRLIAFPRTSLYANAFYLWTDRAGTALAGFVFWTLAARLFDADEVGLGSAAISALTLMALLSHLGLGLGLIRFLPEYGARGPRLINAVFTTSAFSALILSAVFLAGVPLWAPRLDFLLQQPLYSLAFILFVLVGTLCVVQSYAFVAIRKAKYILAQTILIQLSRLALPVLMAVFFGAFGIVASGGIAMVPGAIVGLALLTRGFAGYRPRPVVDPDSVFKVFPFSLANHVAELLLLGPGLLLPIMVVGLLGSTEGAYFYMPWFLGYLLTSASAYLGLSLFAEGSYDRGALRALSRNAVVGGLIVAIVGAAFLLLLGDKLLLAFGRDYATEGATLLRIVALAALPAAVVNVYLGALRVMRRVGELVLIAGVVAVTTLALCSALLPVMGPAGAGVGHGLGQTVGLTVVLSRLLTTIEGTMPQRIRWLLATLAGRS